MVEMIDCASKLNSTTAAGLKRAGVSIVGRYLATSKWKGLTGGEVSAIKESGLKIVSIFEKNPLRRSYFNYARGVQDAQEAAILAGELGQPHGTAVYFTVDYDAQQGDLDEIRDYLKGVKATLKEYKVGLYGSFSVVEAMHGYADYLWQTYAWSRGKVSQYVAIHQYKNGQSLAGVQVDFNDVKKELGTWGDGKADSNPAPKPKPKAPKKEKAPDTYTVRAGDTLSEVAGRYGLDWRKLVTINGIENANVIHPGQKLWLKGGSKKSKPSSGSTYTVHSGHTLSGIAAKHGASWQELARINGIDNPNKIYPGQKIRLKRSTDRPQRVHTVRSGDTLWEVSRNYGTTVKRLKQINDLKSDTIYPGQKLKY